VGSKAGGKTNKQPSTATAADQEAWEGKKGDCASCNLLRGEPNNSNDIYSRYRGPGEAVQYAGAEGMGGFDRDRGWGMWSIFVAGINAGQSV